MDLVRKPVTFELRRLEIARPDLPRGIFTAPFYGKEMRRACVAQVDFLGFSDLLRRAQGKATEVIHDFYQMTELNTRVGALTTPSGQPAVAIFPYADTVNILACDDGPQGIRPVVLGVATLLAALHGRGLPARAGISMGEVWAISRKEGGGSDGDFVSGPAVAAAHGVEAAQEWAGGVLDPYCGPLMRSPATRALMKEGWLVRWNVDVKEGGAVKEKELLAVNWPRVLHVPKPGWLEGVLRCGTVPESGEDSAWRKRKAACRFYDAHGAGTVPEHASDYNPWLLSPSGQHLPIVPGATLPI